MTAISQIDRADGPAAVSATGHGLAVCEVKRSGRRLESFDLRSL